MKQKNRLKLAVYLLMTLTCMTAIFLFSAQDGSDSQKLSDGLLQRIKDSLSFVPFFSGEDAGLRIRKLAHFTEFCGLGVSSCLLAGKIFEQSRRRQLYSALASLLFSVLYACADEFHQYFVPGRAADMADVALDSAGAAFGVLCVLLLRYIMKKKRLKEERI